MKRTFAPFILLLLAACAQVRELHGGEKDTSAPLLLAAEPPDGTVRFGGDRIVLRFNERVKLDRVRDRLLVSPPLDKAPDVKVSGGEEVEIILRAPWAPNTTYTFNIGEAVVDITEGNAAAGLTYVISTGDVLDSLAISGKVIDALTDGPEPGVMVTLHSDTDTTGFSSGRPAYFSRTDEQGTFHLRNLRGGRYRIHALQDQNANFRNDLPNERVAFMDDLVNAHDSMTPVLRMFLPLAGTQQVKEAVVLPDRGWRLVLGRPTDVVRPEPIDRTGGRLSWEAEWNPSRDTVLLWPSDTTLLSNARFAISDSSGVFDTLTYRTVRKMPFLLDVKAAGLARTGVPLFIASRPVSRIDNDRIFLRIDSTEMDVTLEVDTLMRRRLSLTSRVPDVRSATLVLLPGALRDIYEGSNDTLRLLMGSTTAGQTGDLRVNLLADSSAAPAGAFLLQLVNAQGAALLTEEVPALPFRAEFPGTPAGTHSLKLIADSDGDGRWSTGSLKERRQPERVYRHQGDVNVRAGWEVVIDWVVQDR